MANCNCNNGKTFIDFLTTIAGGTSGDSNYLLSLTHYTCGNRKLCINEAFPITSQLNFTPIGTPSLVGDGIYCCDVLCSGTVTYMPYVCGCNCCNVCPVTDNIYCTFCVPCDASSGIVVKGGEVVATPTNVKACCNVTNAISLVTSFNVTATATQSTNPSVVDDGNRKGK